MEPPFAQDLLKLGPLVIRMYAICILSGAVLGGWLGTYRAQRRGYNPALVWDGLVLGLVLGIVGARLWYVASSWPSFQDPSFGKMMWKIVNTTQGGLAIHGAIVGAALTVLIYAYRYKMNMLDWLDILAPCLSVGQAVGRWGNFFNQEAYGGPVTNGLPWNLNIPMEKRIGATRDLAADTRFHPTFLYESLWNLGVLGIIVLAERRWGRHLRRGDSFLLYGVLYSIGRFWIEDLRVDKLCTGGIGGATCANEGLSTARLTSVILIVVCSALFAGRRIVRRSPPASSYQPLDQPWQPEAAPATASAQD